MKPMLYVANVSEDDLLDVDANKHVASVREFAANEGSQVIVVCAKIEEEMASLEDEEKAMFLEELGIDEHYVRIIREMSPIYIPPSNFYVHSFVSYTKKNPEFFLQETEAVELIEFPISSLLSLPDQPKIMALPSTKGYEVPVIDFNGYIIWGATSMILSEFSNLLKNV